MQSNKELISKNSEIALSDIDSLCQSSIELIHYAQHIIVKQVNLVQLMTFYSLGKWIVEKQQNG